MSGLADVGREVRFALRRLRKNPGFTTIAILCLALGIGANAAIFSVVDATLLRPLPYPRPERLVGLFETTADFAPGERGSVSGPNVRDWREQLQSFEGISAYTLGKRALSGPQGAELVRSAKVSANFFQVLGVAPRLGRGFSPGEDTPGSAPVAVVSEELWKRRFDASPTLAGQSLTLDGQPYTVIGVMPAGFRYPMDGRNEVYTPLPVTGGGIEQRGSRFLNVFGRLKSGVSLTAANAELRQLTARLQQAYPDSMAGHGAVALLLTETVLGKVRPVLLVLQGTVLLVLLIACANVANLLLAQGATRRQELAVRLALGASRALLIRQLLVESLMLALAGALAGAALAAWGLSALEGMVSRSLPLAGDISLHGGVFALLLAVAALSAVLFGLFPALQATRTDLRTSLVESGMKSSPSASHRAFRNGLVVGELALSLILLVGAGLLLRGFAALLHEEPGVDARGVLTAHLAVPPYKYPVEEAPRRLLHPLLEQLRAQPGVLSAGLTTLLPIQKSAMSTSYAVAREAPAEPGREPVADLRSLSPGALQSLGIPLRSGRDFTERDGEGELVVIINQALAERHFGQGEAVGQRLTVIDQPATVIGVMGNVRQGGLDEKPRPEIDLPYNHPASQLFGFQNTALVVKLATEPASGVPALRAAVRSLDSELPLDEVRSLQEHISRTTAPRQMSLTLLGTFAAVALVLATAGLYGVISYTVSQRTRELGIRMALGARPGQIVALVMREGALLTALGVVLGLVGALGLSGYLESLVYGVSTRDPLTFGALALLLGGTALLATWVPARRASRVDPIIAIRDE